MSDEFTTVSRQLAAIVPSLDIAPTRGAMYGEENFMVQAWLMVGGAASAAPNRPSTLELVIEWDDLDRDGSAQWITLGGGAVAIHFYKSRRVGLVLESIGIDSPPESTHPLYGEIRRLVGDQAAENLLTAASTSAEAEVEVELDERVLLETCQEIWQALVNAHASGVLADAGQRASTRAARMTELKDSGRGGPSDPHKLLDWLSREPTSD